MLCGGSVGPLSFSRLSESLLSARAQASLIGFCLLLLLLLPSHPLDALQPQYLPRRALHQPPLCRMLGKTPRHRVGEGKVQEDGPGRRLDSRALPHLSEGNCVQVFNISDRGSTLTSRICSAFVRQADEVTKRRHWVGGFRWRNPSPPFPPLSLPLSGLPSSDDVFLPTNDATSAPSPRESFTSQEGTSGRSPAQAKSIHVESRRMASSTPTLLPFNVRLAFTLLPTTALSSVAIAWCSSTPLPTASKRGATSCDLPLMPDGAKGSVYNAMMATTYSRDKEQ
ncbi:hypothetical protein FA13DRAFT_1711576 [Coprinellus micaceus]|uniref:Uncharacterized protein n=1 Tax=Coprinellus micaceus TaxID=71717 RepID=A0A4Y7T5L6_COPMI|nr:hypothetical protein FA13DRAFT_1711576 [Coprinellus micaceus]